jgi:hypothetical protein
VARDPNRWLLAAKKADPDWQIRQVRMAAVYVSARLAEQKPGVTWVRVLGLQNAPTYVPIATPTSYPTATLRNAPTSLSVLRRANIADGLTALQWDDGETWTQLRSPIDFSPGVLHESTAPISQHQPRLRVIPKRSTVQRPSRALPN